MSDRVSCSMWRVHDSPEVSHHMQARSLTAVLEVDEDEGAEEEEQIEEEQILEVEGQGGISEAIGCRVSGA